jgi:hypothetical protein
MKFRFAVNGDSLWDKDIIDVGNDVTKVQDIVYELMTDEEGTPYPPMFTLMIERVE